MSNSANLETFVSEFLKKAKTGNDKEELVYAENLPNTKSVTELLQRVTRTPQILHSLITTSLPYLLLSPQKRKHKKLMRSNKSKAIETRKVKNRLNKKTIYTKTSGAIIIPNCSDPKLLTQSLSSTSKQQAQRQNDSVKKKVPLTKQSKVSMKKLKTNLALDMKSNLSVNNPKIKIKKEPIPSLTETLKHSLLDDSINAQKKVTTALKHSSLFSITEKSHLSLNNYAPVEVDTLLLQKLIALDKKAAKKVINHVLNTGEEPIAGGASIFSSGASDADDDEQGEKSNKPKKKRSDLKRTLIRELQNILSVRLKADKERPAEILYNVVLKLCKKNKIVNGVQFRRVQHLKRPTEPSYGKLNNKITSKLRQGTLKSLINQHQQLLEKIHS